MFMLIFYSGVGQWCFDEFPYGRIIILTDLVRETGFFELGGINSDEIEFSKKTTVYYLNPTNKHEKGVEPPFIPNLGELDIPYFQLSKPINLTNDDVFKENIEVAEDIGAESQVSRSLEETIEKSGGKRTSQLYIFIWRVHEFLNKEKKPTAQQVWNEIQHRHKNYDDSEIIQSVDGAEILWRSGYGNEQKLKRNTFNKTLSNIRKNPPL